MSAEFCHSLLVRLPGKVDPNALAERLASIIRARPAVEGHISPALWIERAPQDDEAIRRRLDAEHAFPVTPEQGLRAVLLCRYDGRADLVLVAHRTAADRRSLRLLADLVAGEKRELCWSADAPAERNPVPTGTPAWAGRGSHAGGGVHELSGSGAAGGDPGTWLAALATVLARYQDGEGSMAAVLPAVDRPELALGGFDSVAHYDIPASRGSLAEVAAHFRSSAEPASAPAPVGLVCDAFGSFDTEHESAGIEPEAGHGAYRAWLRPPFPLTIEVGPTRLRYAHDETIAPGMAAQFVRHLAAVHRQVLTSPDLPADEAELFDEPERRRILALGDSAPLAPGTAGCIHDVFTARAAERPDAVALSYGQHHVTYRELDELSDRLAHGLRQIGVRERDRVGISLERSGGLVAAMLGVLKAGAIYVPMDPSYPVERLAYTATDAGIGVVVTTRDEFPADARLVSPQRLEELGAGVAADGPPAVAATATDPAYVIYTSGSTGRPKGVVVPHQNVIALLDATRDEFELAAADVWTLFHSSSFDFSVWEIWGCLLTGARLVVVPFWASRSPEEFHDLLADERVTVLNQTPSAFIQLSDVDRTRPRELAVRLMIFGGEPLDTGLLLPWFDRHPETHCRVVNMFGITETTVHVTAQTVTRRLALEASRSVGKALPGWQVRVVDTAGRLVPPGVAGEIHVGGAGVALGYLNRPELNAERFITDPFRDERSGDDASGGGPCDDRRLYRSGDRGRLLQDGTLEHVGRIDNQVKIRGFRIELDEIRSVLTEDPAVTAAAVVVRPGDAATAGIDAYVVLDESSTAEVRRRVGRILPDYMVPTSVTAVPYLPLTPSGKVDTSRLPASTMPNGAVADRRPVSGTGQSAQVQKPEQPGSPGELGRDDALIGGLQEVWSAVLGLEVGPDDDFFDLGGNSLLAVRLAAASRERGMPELSLRELYRHPTIRGLVEAVRSQSAP
ncbi:amino acid adenylation domain-containing protein [Streptomyces sp. NPDC007905]|uniref:amino acid adenylation domain-containing protein n=1 Tax=Streptomyces sp. NPDC007905 TaxID=3364788 RepID=UPI0036E1CEEB